MTLCCYNFVHCCRNQGGGGGGILLSFIKFEFCREHVIHQIVKVFSIDEPLSLVAWVHGGPAELVVSHLPLHEAPHRTAHHRYGVLVGHDQDFAHLVDLNSLAEELACGRVTGTILEAMLIINL